MKIHFLERDTETLSTLLGFSFLHLFFLSLLLCLFLAVPHSDYDNESDTLQFTPRGQGRHTNGNSLGLVGVPSRALLATL